MHADLETVLQADEEARARVALAEERRTRGVAEAVAARDAAVDARRRAARAALDEELHAIRSDGDRRVQELATQQEEFLAAVRRAADTKIDDGIAAYLRIVGGGK